MSNAPTPFYCSGCKITHAGECEPRIVNIETGETLADMFMREAAILQLGQTLSVPEPPKANITIHRTCSDGSVRVTHPDGTVEVKPGPWFGNLVNMETAAVWVIDVAPSVPEPPKATLARLTQQDVAEAHTALSVGSCGTASVTLEPHGGIYYAIYNDGSVFYSDEFAQKVIAKTDLATLLKETNSQTRGPDGVAAFSPREPERPKADWEIQILLRQNADTGVWYAQASTPGYVHAAKGESARHALDCLTLRTAHED